MKLSLDLPNAGSTPACLTISGELDQTVLTKDYWQTLSKADQDAVIQAKRLDVDLVGVDRADTAGLAWLINLMKDANANNVKVSFQSVPAKLQNLADLSGAKEMLLD